MRALSLAFAVAAGSSRGRRRGLATFAALSASALALVGCTAQGASTGNFTLTPATIGWYVGDEARFFLNISSSLTHSSPSFTIDRQFAIEEIRFAEKGLSFGHDH